MEQGEYSPQPMACLATLFTVCSSNEFLSEKLLKNHPLTVLIKKQCVLVHWIQLHCMLVASRLHQDRKCFRGEWLLFSGINCFANISIFVSRLQVI